MVALSLALVAVAIVALWVGADQFVDGAARIAAGLGVPGLIIGLTVVAIGTSAPEFAVTLDAALAGQPAISVANVVGSNVLNLGFILGSVALVQALATTTALVRRDGLILVAATAVLLWVIQDGTVGSVEGIVLFTLLVVYILVLAKLGNSRQLGADPDPPAALDVVRLVGGLALVVVGAHLLVLGAVDIAETVGLSQWAIGITVVALGTSLPELATSLTAARRGRMGISAGNLVGSSIFNILGVLGLAAAIEPLPVGRAGLEGTAWLMGMVVLVVVLLHTEQVLTRLEGALLVGLNAVNWALALW